MWWLFIAAAAVAIGVQLYRLLGSYDPDSTQPQARQLPTPVTGASVDSDLQRRTEFMAGAVAGYRMITEALFAGDLTSCADFLEPQVRESFEAQIAGHRTAGRTLRLSENLIESYDLINMSTQNNTDEAVMRFQVSLKYASRVGDAETHHSTRLTYLWTFRKPTTSDICAWKLSAVDIAS